MSATQLLRLGLLFTSTILIAQMHPLIAWAQTAPIYHLRNHNSNYHLTQDYSGNRDDKRNVSVWPLPKQRDDGFRWHFGPADGGHYYIVNMQSGLVLTQDGSGDNRNVSNWGRLESSHRQQWKLVRHENTNMYMIINRETGQGLDQSHQGRRDDKRNVTTWPGQNFSDGGFTWHLEKADDAELVQLTLESVKCIKPSTGQDEATKVLFLGIDLAIQAGIAAASGGASAAAKAAVLGKTVTKKAIISAAKRKAKSKVKRELRGRARDAVDEADPLAALDDISVEAAFNKIYGESPDDLEVKINNVSVWPNGGRDHRKIKSQQIMHVNVPYVFDKLKGLVIQLVEHDYGSGDDNLGRIRLDTRQLRTSERFDEVLLHHKGEGSIYLVTFRLDPVVPAFNPQHPPQADSCDGPAHVLRQRKSGL